MASVKPYRKGYRAFIRLTINGEKYSDSKTFRTIREANAWASFRENEIRSEAIKPKDEKNTLRALLEKYRDEVSPTKRGTHWEVIRINKFTKDEHLHVDNPLNALTSEVIGLWRDIRLKTCKSSTVLRELGLLSAIFEYARRELKWIKENPVKDTRKPKSIKHREVIITRHQIKGVLKQLKHSKAHKVDSVGQSIAICFLVALRTGMRAGELSKLTWDRVHDNYCVLNETKTIPRNVPLSKKTMLLINRMKGYDNKLVFGRKSGTLDTMFRRARQDAKLSGFTFHDARHTAATWIVRTKKIDVLTLCKIFGWSDTKQALTYFNPKAHDLASLLD